MSGQSYEPIFIGWFQEMVAHVAEAQKQPKEQKPPVTQAGGQ